MTLATADPDGRPSARVVLLRGLDDRGITFFTNRSSRKGSELEHNPYAAAVLHWWELGRQVRIEGAVEQTTDEESTAYWQSRPRGSQLAAWASPQSQRLSGRDELDIRVAEAGGAIRRSRRPPPAVLGRLPPRRGERRVLDASRRQASRPRPLPPRVRRLAPRATRALTSRAPRARRPCTGPRDSRACTPWRRTPARRRSAP